MFTDFICIRDGQVVLVDINLDVILNSAYKKFQDQLTIQIQRRINSFFNLQNWDYGQTLKSSDIVKALSDLNQIESFEISFVTNNPNNGGNMVTTNFYEIIRPDITNIIFTYQ